MSRRAGEMQGPEAATLAVASVGIAVRSALGSAAAPPPSPLRGASGGQPEVCVPRVPAEHLSCHGLRAGKCSPMPDRGTRPAVPAGLRRVVG
jgi:hypothetical protein